MAKAQIFLSGIVGEAYYEDYSGYITLASVRNAVGAAGPFDELEVWLNSPGGSVDEGWAIHDYLRALGVPVSVVGIGQVYSIASIILQAGRPGRRYLTESAKLMIHNPWGGRWGDADDMEQYAKILRAEENRLAEFYAQITDTDASIMRELMKEETYFSASEAIEIGLVDAIYQADTMPEQVMAFQSGTKVFAMINPERLKAKQAVPQISNMADNKQSWLDALGEKIAKGLMGNAQTTTPPAPAVEEAPAPIAETNELDSLKAENDELKKQLAEAQQAATQANAQAVTATEQVNALKKTLQEVADEVQALKELPLVNPNAPKQVAPQPQAKENGAFDFSGLKQLVLSRNSHLS